MFDDDLGSNLTSSRLSAEAESFGAGLTDEDFLSFGEEVFSDDDLVDQFSGLSGLSAVDGVVMDDVLEDDDYDGDDVSFDIGEVVSESFGALSDDDIDAFSVDDDLDDEVFGADAAPSTPAGRVDMARRVRRTLYGIAPPSEAEQSGYYAGYLKCCEDLGIISDSSAPEAFGGILKALGRGIGRGITGLGRVALAGGQGLLGGKSLAELAHEVGSGAREGVGVPQEGAARDLGVVLGRQLAGSSDDEDDIAADDASQPVEADSEELPPVYVADSEGADEYLLMAGEEDYDIDVSDEVDADETFGATAKRGLLGRQRRHRARDASIAAMRSGAAKLRSVERGAPSVFVCDPGAKPVLRSNGAISDAVYGALSPVPCPSCCRVHDGAAFGSEGASCAACDDYGAILVPDSDLSSYSGVYGAVLLSLLGAGLSAGVGAANSAGLLDAPKRRIRDFAVDRGWMDAKRAERRKAGKSGTPTDPPAAEAPESFGGEETGRSRIRMIAPGSWCKDRLV